MLESILKTAGYMAATAVIALLIALWFAPQGQVAQIISFYAWPLAIIYIALVLMVLGLVKMLNKP